MTIVEDMAKKEGVIEVEGTVKEFSGLTEIDATSVSKVDAGARLVVVAPLGLAHGTGADPTAPDRVSSTRHV